MTEKEFEDIYREALFEEIYLESIFKNIYKATSDISRFIEMTEEEFVVKCKENTTDELQNLLIVGFNFGLETEFGNQYMLDRNKNLTEREIMTRILDWNRKQFMERKSFVLEDKLKSYFQKFFIGLNSYKKACEDFDNRIKSGKLPANYNKRKYLKAVSNKLKYNLQKKLGIDGYYSVDERNKTCEMVDSIYRDYIAKNGNFPTAR